MRPASRTSTHQLPTYALYGEASRSLGVEWLHCESIAARSRLHDWEIRPHRHDALFQFLYVRKGSARVLAEGRHQALKGPCLVTVPAVTAHGFSFSEDVDGVVITVVERHLRRLLDADDALADQVLRLRATRLSRDAVAVIGPAAAAVRDEHASHQPWRALALDAALLRLALAVGRSLPSDEQGAPTPDARAMVHLQRFRELVERRFREQPGLSECASELGITPTHLNRLCRRFLGHSALGVIHARAVLEAQRELAYTTLSIKQIGLGLGFQDPGYFTRFFLRETGRTPSAWREEASSR